MSTSKQPRLYDRVGFTQKLLNAIDNLEKTQLPGQNEKVTKGEILNGNKDRLREVMERGYTPKQLVEAMKAEGFLVSPKQIKEIFEQTQKAASVQDLADKRVGKEKKPTKNKPTQDDSATRTPTDSSN